MLNNNLIESNNIVAEVMNNIENNKKEFNELIIEATARDYKKRCQMRIGIVNNPMYTEEDSDTQEVVNSLSSVIDEYEQEFSEIISSTEPVQLNQSSSELELHNELSEILKAGKTDDETIIRYHSVLCKLLSIVDNSREHIIAYVKNPEFKKSVDSMQEMIIDMECKYGNIIKDKCYVV